MDKTLFSVCLILLIGIGSAEAALEPSSHHRECFTELVDDSNYAENHESCLNALISDYDYSQDAHNRTSEDLKHAIDLYEEFNTDVTAEFESEVALLKSEAQLWKSKYHYVIVQHGNYSIQDQITNLTERVSTVETKARTNESLIFIIQNMLRNVQVDIDSIWLKINSVR